MKYCSSRDVENAMYRARRRAEPAIPTSAADFATVMADPAGSRYNQHYKATVTEGDDLAVIFISSVILRRLVEVQDGFYDGTFFTVPLMFYQAFTIMGMFRNHCIPLIHILMTGKCQPLYKKVTEKIRQLAPNFLPSTFMGDFEIASRNAMQESFPDCCLGGCSFHFCQAIWKKCQKLGLTDAYKQKFLLKKS